MYVEAFLPPLLHAYVTAAIPREQHGRLVAPLGSLLSQIISNHLTYDPVPPLGGVALAIEIPDADMGEAILFSEQLSAKGNAAVVDYFQKTMDYTFRVFMLGKSCDHEEMGESDYVLSAITSWLLEYNLADYIDNTNLERLRKQWYRFLEKYDDGICPILVI